MKKLIIAHEKLYVEVNPIALHRILVVGDPYIGLVHMEKDEGLPSMWVVWSNGSTGPIYKGLEELMNNYSECSFYQI